MFCHGEGELPGSLRKPTPPPPPKKKKKIDLQMVGFPPSVPMTCATSGKAEAVPLLGRDLGDSRLNELLLLGLV